MEAPNAPPRDPKAYADFLDVLITELGHTFDWVELWNEPTNLLDWDWRLDPEWRTFAAMVGGAAYWMRRRGKKVLLGGNAPTDLHWLREMHRAGVLAHVDAVGLHGFPGTWSVGWQGWAAELGAVREALATMGVAAEVWITEAGVSTLRHDEARQAKELHGALNAGADRLYWYALDDLDPARSTQQGFHVDERHYHMGLFRADGTRSSPPGPSPPAGSQTSWSSRRRASAPRLPASL
jgi:CDP-paratose 2-epimerase